MKEVDALLRVVIGIRIEPAGIIRKSHFFRLMSKPIMKCALLQVLNYTLSANSLSSDLPLSLKVLKFQRKIMIAGIKGQVLGS